MGTVIKFPDDGRIVRFGREAGESATIIILPVIRIERYPELIRRYRAADAATRRKWRPAARQAALTKIHCADVTGDRPRRLRYCPIATESGTLRPPAPVVPSASGRVRAPKRAER